MLDTSQITRGDRAFSAWALRVFVYHAVPETGDVPEYGEVKARVFEFKAKGVFPVEPTTHRIGGLAVAQVF